MVPSPSVDPSEYLSVLVLVNYASALANTMIFYNQDWVWPSSDSNFRTINHFIYSESPNEHERIVSAERGQSSFSDS